MRLIVCLATILLVPIALGQQKGSSAPSTMNKMLDNMKKLISNKMTRRLDRMSMKTAAAATVPAKPVDDAPSQPIVQSQPVITGGDEGIKGASDNTLTVSGDSNGMSGGSILTISDSNDMGNSVGVQMSVNQGTMVQQSLPQQQPPQQQQLSFTDILFNALIVEELLRQVQQPTNNNYGFDTGYQQPSSQTQSNDFAAFAVMDGGGMGIMDGMI